MLHATVTLSACAIGAALAAGPARAQAPIVTDGTMGARVELNGPAMQIPHTLGTQSGTNLFHSFQRFDIPTGSSATFTGPGGIDNVISRVTGGEASTIDGAFRSTIPGANVWFANPAGVTFGPNASLDVPASFHASTANEIRFPDGGRFSADLGATSTLSVAPPEAFGFLSSNPAPLKVERSHLSTGTGATLSLAAGGIDIQGNAPEFSSGLQTPSGTINLASVAGPAEVKTDGTVSGNNHGAIRLTDGALVDASGDGAGVVRIRGGEITFTGSRVLASNTGSVAGAGGIDISADRISLQADGPFRSVVAADALNEGGAAPINVRAPDITIQNSAIQTLTNAAGKAGNIRIDAPNQMTLDDFGRVSASSLSSDPAGAGGEITVHAGNLVIRGHSLIKSTTEGPALAGNIRIDVPNQMTLDDFGRVIASSAPSMSVTSPSSSDPAGAGGEITVHAGDLVIRRQSQFSSITRGPAPGGNINVTAGTLLVDSALAAGEQPPPCGVPDCGNATGIGVSALPALIGGITVGRAGNVSVSADQIRLTNRASIKSETEGPHDAGKINLIVDSGTLTVESGSVISSNTSAKGNAGSVTVQASTGTVRVDRSSISSSSLGEGAPGGVIITGVSKLFLSDGASVTTQSGSTGGGNIEISGAGTIVLRDGSRIGVDVAEGGTRAGNIAIGSRFLMLDRSAISATADAGSGGDIRVASDFVFRSPDSEITARAGPAGVAGNVVLTSPEADVTGGLTPLPGKLMDAAGQMQVRCAARGGVEGSSFTIAGSEARSPALEGYLAGTYAAVADETTAVTDGSLMVVSGGGLASPAWTVACDEAR